MGCKVRPVNQSQLYYQVKKIPPLLYRILQWLEFRKHFKGSVNINEKLNVNLAASFCTFARSVRLQSKAFSCKHVQILEYEVKGAIFKYDLYSHSTILADLCS